MTRPQRTGVRHRAWRRFGLSGAVLAAAAIVAIGLTGCGSGKHRSARTSAAESYGSLPSFLPTPSVAADAPLSGSTTRPALTSQGDEVVVQAAGASLAIKVVGPVVPGEGLPYQPPATTCTWTITLSQASVTMPIVINHFNAIDQFGKVYHVALVPGQPKPPASIGPGHTVTFELRAVLPTGEGDMRYTPDGQRVAASWDFVVEND